MFACFFIFRKMLTEPWDNNQLNAYYSMREKEMVTMTNKTVKMLIPTIGVVEFVEDNDFRDFLKELTELKTIEEIRAKSESDAIKRAAYAAEFWESGDCE